MRFNLKAIPGLYPAMQITFGSSFCAMLEEQLVLYFSEHTNIFPSLAVILQYILCTEASAYKCFDYQQYFHFTECVVIFFQVI